jgi:hypothetical protein
MSTIQGNQTLTVNTVARTYVLSWNKKYAKDLAKNNTSIKEAPLSAGSSIMRVTHDAQGVIEKHILSVEDSNDVNGVVELDKIQITLTCKDDPTAQARLVNLAAGVAAYLAQEGVLESLCANMLG